MRIVSGKYKGVHINSPKGRSVRPTTDRVRESMFSTLLSEIKHFDSINIIDAFAGSGALSFEGLSRGAEYAMLFEKNRKNIYTIKENASKLSIDNCKYDIFCTDVFNNNFIKIKEKGLVFDVVFLDPPYNYSPSKIIQFIANSISYVIDKDSIIVYEHRNNSIQEDDYSILNQFGYNAFKEKKYGDTELTYIKSYRERGKI